MADLELQVLKGRKPEQGPPPDMNHMRPGYSSPSELKAAALNKVHEDIRRVVADVGKS